MPSIHLTEHQISQLVEQGCSAYDWTLITVTEPARLERIQRVHFIGHVHVGNLNGTCRVDNVEMPCGLYSAALSDCMIGDRVRIANIGSVVSNYHIGDDVVIQDVASMTAGKGSRFGNGIELETINEGGGRGVKIFNDLTSQLAYMQGIMKHNAELSSALSRLIDAKVAGSVSEQGSVGAHAKILHCGPISDVCVGPSASIIGAKQLHHGTVNSCIEHPTSIGHGVFARDFIVSEGATIDSGALIDKCFVGQGVKMGKQYSAENSLFFANCEAFHGEAVSLFAGPYTVTHHKSTLLIAGLFSFYNAGSGTNQSNHMYKLGPVHQGVLERGCKTGSFSYLLFEAHIGAFSVIIGKHYSNINTPHLPFSYIFEEEGKSKVVPGMNLGTIGIVRDGEKWPKRDNRKALNKRDLMIFDVFTPYTVEKMRLGRKELLALNDTVPKEKTSILYGGAFLSRLILKKGAKFYEQAITRYLNGKIAGRLLESLKKESSWSKAVAALVPAGSLKQSSEWTDVGGLILPRERLLDLERGILNGEINSYEMVVDAFQQILRSYPVDEWRYIYDAFQEEHGIDLGQLTKQQAEALVIAWEKNATSLQSMVLDDSRKEYGAFAHIGFGLDRTEPEAQKDFEHVRGTVESNSVVQKMAQEVQKILAAKEEFLTAIQTSPE